MYRLDLFKIFLLKCLKNLTQMRFSVFKNVIIFQLEL